MMKIVFLVASASADLSKIRSPLADIKTEHVQEAIADTLSHMSNGDCQKLKLHVSPKLKESLKRMGEVIDDLGNIVAVDNPMVSPIVMMAKSYILTSGNSAIDTAVNDHACEYMIHSVPPAVKSQVLPIVNELVKHLGDPKKCDDLKHSIKTAAGHVRRTASDLADSVTQQLLEQFDQTSMSPFVAMGKEWFLGMVDSKLHEMIDSHLCPLVYGAHTDEL
jgi:hypothetical protein